MSTKKFLKTVYPHSLGLLVDLYQFTMAYGYWKKGIQDKEAVFHFFFRKRPFNGGIAVAAGLEIVIEFFQNFKFSSDDLSFLETLKNSQDKPLFEQGFLDYLSNFSFGCDVDAMPEGTAAFPYQPLLRIKGPILHAQLIESPLLNIINFQTLIATKAARICWAATPDPVIEFGLRRAQGIDGALSAARAAYIGGCEGTSNVMAGQLFNIPIRGTHAHSWIMAFEEETEAFEAFAEVMPKNCIFLVDTYDTIQGVKNAIKVAQKLRSKGVEMAGVRLDSGDLAQLSIRARKILDEAGFKNTKIMASNELDEYIIYDLKHQGAQINLWGVGTNLVTGKDQPALDGVYKLSALREKHGQWQYKLKLSEQMLKMTDPGILQVRRFFNEQGNIADMMYDLQSPIPSNPVIIDAVEPISVVNIASECSYEDLLIPIMRQGKLVYDFPSLKQVQGRTLEQLSRFPSQFRRFLYPQPYFCGLAKSLYEKKLMLIDEIKKKKER